MNFLKHPDVMAYTPTKNSTLKDATNNCGTSKVARATSGRDRTKIDMSIALNNTYDNLLPGGPIPMTILNNSVLIRPYTLLSRSKKPAHSPKLIKVYGCPDTRTDCRE